MSGPPWQAVGLEPSPSPEATVDSQVVSSSDDLSRYQRQVACDHLGSDGQLALGRSRVLVVGVGGLGSWTSEILARSGVGMLRLVDDDVVEVNNIHRQTYYTEDDDGRPKAEVAAERLARINSAVGVETRVERVDAGNIAELAGGIDLIIDGTDNFATRFVLNDIAVRESIPWVFTGVLGSEAQTMTIIPGKTPCLRCLYDGPPAAGLEPSSITDGVLPSVVVSMCGIMATEAMKILSGHPEAVSPYLLKVDRWTNTLHRIDVAAAGAETDCPCCRKRRFEYLECPDNLNCSDH